MAEAASQSRSWLVYQVMDHDTLIQPLGLLHQGNNHNNNNSGLTTRNVSFIVDPGVEAYTYRLIHGADSLICDANDLRVSTVYQIRLQSQASVWLPSLPRPGLRKPPSLSVSVGRPQACTQEVIGSEMPDLREVAPLMRAPTARTSHIY